MNRVKQKLQSERGVSFLFALLAFMIAAMVSATIIAASMSALKSVNDDRKQEQAHLALTSAAQFIQEQIDDKSDSGTDTVRTTCTITTKTQGTTIVSGPSYTGSGTFETEMLAAVQQVWGNNLAYSAENAFTIDADLTGVTQDNDASTVMVSVSASRDDKNDSDAANDTLITIFKLQLDGTDDVLYLKMTGAPKSTTTTSTSYGKTYVTTTTQFTWSSGMISNKAGDLE